MPSQPWDFLRRLAAIIHAHEPLIAQIVRDGMFAAWLQGQVDVLPPKEEQGFPFPPAPEPVLPPPEPPRSPLAPTDAEPIIVFPILESAVSILQVREVLTPEEYERKAQQAETIGFTVARLGSEDAIAKVQELLVENIKQGETSQDFAEAVDESIDRSALSDAQIEAVYRMTVGVAYAQGQDHVLENPMVKSEFPFRWTVPTRDSRLTELCEIVSASGLNGTGIFYADDPVWREYAPTRHWGCRCVCVPLSIEDAAARGVEAAKVWLETGEPPYHLLFAPRPPVDLPKGWIPPLLQGT